MARQKFPLSVYCTLITLRIFSQCGIKSSKLSVSSSTIQHTKPYLSRNAVLKSSIPKIAFFNDYESSVVDQFRDFNLPMP